MLTGMVLLLEVAAAAAFSKMGAALAAAIAAVGAAAAIGNIGMHAMDSIARQPEAAGSIRANMILLAAFIEGLGLFAIIVAILVLFL